MGAFFCQQKQRDASATTITGIATVIRPIFVTVSGQALKATVHNGVFARTSPPNVSEMIANTMLRASVNVLPNRAFNSKLAKAIMVPTAMLSTRRRSSSPSAPPAMSPASKLHADITATTLINQ